MSDALLQRIVHQILLRQHPLPWRIEWDWTCEVLDARNQRVLSCRTAAEADELITLGRAIATESAVTRAEIEALLLEDA